MFGNTFNRSPQTTVCPIDSFSKPIYAFKCVYILWTINVGRVSPHRYVLSSHRGMRSCPYPSCTWRTLQTTDNHCLLGWCQAHDAGRKFETVWCTGVAL